MKKVILAVSVVLFLVSCGGVKKWTDVEKEKVRTVVRDHKEKSFLRFMAKENLGNLQECVVTTVEATYPDYNDFNQLTGQTDTLVGVTVDCVSDMLGSNYENLPMIFPYDQLQAASILPAGLTPDQVGMFYLCLSNKIQSVFPSPSVFVMSMMSNANAINALMMMMQECATSIMPPSTTAPAK